MVGLITIIMVFSVFSSSSYGFGEVSPPEIMEKYGKSVVLILTVKNNKEMGLGSGFLIKSDGVIVTNYHVIKNSYPIVVRLMNGDVYDDLSVIDYNERMDVAVIKIKGFDLPFLRLGNSNNVKVGERVTVIGNPDGFANTISDGLLSQIRDSGGGYTLHQISAPISPGSSGSPVFNEKGEVIGVATLSDVFGQNINFSVPINYARPFVEEKPKMTLAEFVERSNKQKTYDGLPPQKYEQQEPNRELPSNVPQDLFAYHDIDIGHSPILGNPNAPITIVEFADFQCPFSQKFHPIIMEVLKAYPNDVKYVFKNFPLPFHPFAQPAVKALLAAGEQGKYWEMMDILFKNGSRLDKVGFDELADQVGIDVKKFNEDLRQQNARWEALMKEDMAEADKAHVPGTPVYFINGRYSLSRDLSSFQKEINGILLGRSK